MDIRRVSIPDDTTLDVAAAYATNFIGLKPPARIIYLWVKSRTEVPLDLTWGEFKRLLDAGKAKIILDYGEENDN